MSEHTNAGPAPENAGAARHSSPDGPHENLSTQQMRTIGQRRSDAEEKLARHLEQAEHPPAEKHPAADKPTDQ
ncbi:hypothetical protein ACQCSX_22265 (plasmid) [Pseudarthrobacter sp. P1]|uniref:hypothetical protein n=1 Tax=Pseudarthrobacter sp. P1 TaxID=3418418 RepID=UPI003CE8072C